MTIRDRVMLGDKEIGWAETEQQGLYCFFRIRCSLSGEVLYRVLVRGEAGEENLGVLVPVEDAFGLETRIPFKRIGPGPYRFVALPRHGELRGRFVPLMPEEPFRYITRLKDCYLEYRRGIAGVVIKEPDAP